MSEFDYEIGVIIAGSKGDILPLTNYCDTYFKNRSIMYYIYKDLTKYMKGRNYTSIDLEIKELFALHMIADIKNI